MKMWHCPSSEDQWGEDQWDGVGWPCPTSEDQWGGVGWLLKSGVLVDNCNTKQNNIILLSSLPVIYEV